MHTILRSSLVFGAAASAVITLLVACGSSDESTFGNPNAPEGGLPDPGPLSDGGKPDGGDPVGTDLPAPNCPAPTTEACCKDPNPPRPDVGGTEKCPGDKNLPGCGCDTPGQTAACWTGKRANRNHGVCKDGTTTCTQSSENTRVWSDCVGEVLPTAGATKGAAACTCFSKGQWKIANLSPCTLQYTDGSGTVYNAVSTVLDGSGVAQCPAENPPTAAPATDWSTDTLNVDCAGHFKLCLRIRQGVFESPSPSDCILGEVCTEADYTTPNVDQAWPNLKGWLGTDKACAKKWDDISNNTPTVSAGYAEMIVKGTSVACDAIDDGSGGDFVFNRVKYCPRSCQNDPTTPDCKACQQSGQGQF
jgi:hypothetical protein